VKAAVISRNRKKRHVLINVEGVVIIDIKTFLNVDVAITQSRSWNVCQPPSCISMVSQSRTKIVDGIASSSQVLAKLRATTLTPPGRQGDQGSTIKIDGAT
jgi:hypothetical protein